MKFKLRLQCSLNSQALPAREFPYHKRQKAGQGLGTRLSSVCSFNTHSPASGLSSLSIICPNYAHICTHTHMKNTHMKNTQSVDIQVQFTPRLDPEAIHQEALKLATTLTPQTQALQTPSIEQLQEADQQPSPVSRTIALPLFLPYCKRSFSYHVHSERK